MAVQAQQRYSPEEYLELERKAECKSEYLNGFIFAMAGGSREHNVIAGNAFARLHAQVTGRPCEVYMSDMRVKISDTGLYTYPDVVVVCGERRFEDSHVDTLLNPTVLIEVLSESTEAYDRGDKFAHYRRLDSLAEYVMIAQDKIRVEQYARQGNKWILTEFSQLSDTLPLASIGCDLPLREIYDRIEFPGDDQPVRPDGAGQQSEAGGEIDRAA
jgi:Uma2 family endonuclease